jgi:RNA polymerase sigma-B factor
MAQHQLSTARRNQRVESHLHLVEPWVRRYSRRSAEAVDDLRQVALEGLIRAAERFNGDKQVPFEAFARPHIRGAVLHYLRDCSHVIRIPRRLQEQRLSADELPLKRVAYSPHLNDISAASADAAPVPEGLVAALLAGLQPRQRQLVELVVLKGVSLRAAAQMQGTSASTVHRRLQHTLAQLRPQLNRAFDAPGC